MVSGEGRQALVRGTTRRFLLLLCVLLVACLVMFSTMALAMRPESFRQCLLTAAAIDLDGLLLPFGLASHEPFVDCRSDAAGAAAGSALLATGAVVLAALMLYWWLPSWRNRGSRLLPATAFDVSHPGAIARAEPLTDELARLSRRAGISRAPQFVVDPGAMTAGAVAFGRAGRYTVCLNAGLIPRRTSDPEMFEAVLLHELAHIRNRDVDITYLAVALWRVLLVATLLPYLALLSWLWFQSQVLGVDQTQWANATPSIGKAVFGAVLAAQVYLARAEVLRHRELCADLDSIRLGADPAVWGSPQLARPDGAGRAGTRLVAVVRWFSGLWRTHPSWQQRHRLLTGAGAIQTGATGLQGLLFLSAFVFLVSPMWANPGWPAWLFAMVAYLVGPLIIIMMAVDMPEKSSRSVRLRTAEPRPSPAGGPAAPAAPAERGAHRRPRLGWRLALAAAVVGALFMFDPLHGFSGGGISGTLVVPPEYELEPVRWPPLRQPSPEQASGQVSGWLDAGGRDVGARLHEVLAVAPGRFADVPPGSTERDAYTEHCAAARQVVADADGLPLPPLPLARRAWQVLVISAQEGSETLCSPGPREDGHVPGARSAEGYYATARSAYDSVELFVNLYAPGSLPAR